MVKLLDCTLRDGGYLNDWEFGNSNIINIFERLVAAEVDIIETGFIDDRREYDPNRSIFPDTASINKTYGCLDRGKSIIVGMIDYGTCSIDNVQPQRECFLDGIRVIFKKAKMHEAIDFCRQVKEKGYKVFVQAVSITSYNDAELSELIKLVNGLEPYAFSLVDTYGLLHKGQLMHYYHFACEHLKKTIGIGYHAHNNFQLAYANCIELLENPPKDRMLVVDGTIYGMGKSAGNTPIELLIMYMNEYKGTCYHNSQILEAIDVTMLDINRKIRWGYGFKFFVAASKDCHPNYVNYLMDMGKLSMKSVSEILDRIEPEKKLLYDADYIKQLYFEYQKNDCDDSNDLDKLMRELNGKNVLLLGPGNNIYRQRDKVETYIAEHTPEGAGGATKIGKSSGKENVKSEGVGSIIGTDKNSAEVNVQDELLGRDFVTIAINFIPEGYKADYIFMSNAKRYVQLCSALNMQKEKSTLIATSNITRTLGEFDYTLNYAKLLDEAALMPDNPMIMVLRLLKAAGANSIALAGFDGYREASLPNYVNPNMEYTMSREQAAKINDDAISGIKKLGLDKKVIFVTDTCYA